ncbi:MAG: nitroreductase family protein [Actinomycetota bacterium]
MVAPLSAHPRRDPVIEDARAGVALADEAAVRAFRKAPHGASAAAAGDPGAGLLSDDAFEDVVRRRGSSRAFARTGLPSGEYAALADLALAGFAGDRSAVPLEALVVASALEGLEPGAYAYGPGFRPLRAGEFRRQAAYLCLEQRLGADAAAVTFLAADLRSAVDGSGGRGYGWAQLGAAVAAGRMYLGAYGQCLGATGTTFYDDEVRSFFGTDAEPMMAVALGPEGRRRSIRRCRAELEGGPGG